MANNRTNGIEYFPIDVDMIHDEKIKIVCAKHGRTNTLAVIFWTLSHLYRQGYFYNWSKDNLAIFSMELGIEKDNLNELIFSLVEVGFFNKNIFEKYQVLTSKSTQTRYSISTRKRKNVDIQPQYWLIDFPVNGLAEKPKSQYYQTDGSKASISESVPPNGRNLEGTDSKNGNILTTSKVKESKVKETPPTPSFLEGSFSDFFLQFPSEKQVGEFDAKRHWDMIRDSEEKAKAIETVSAYLNYAQEAGIFTCTPANFLKQKRYLDDWDAQTENLHKQKKPNQPHIETEAREPYKLVMPRSK